MKHTSQNGTRLLKGGVITDCNLTSFLFRPAVSTAREVLRPDSTQLRYPEIGTPENGQICPEHDFSHFGSAPLMD